MSLGYHFRKITNSGQFIRYFQLENDAEALKGQLLYRSKNLGVKELDLIIGSWATHNLKTLSQDQLLEYHQEVLQQETPDLWKKVLGYEPIGEE
ncbi:unnamed protein product [Sphagnum balticum]